MERHIHQRKKAETIITHHAHQNLAPAGEHGRTGVEIYRPDMTGADVAQELLHADPHSIDTRAKVLKSLSPEQRHTLREGSGDYQEFFSARTD
jgi:hypothetical protein